MERAERRLNRNNQGIQTTMFTLGYEPVPDQNNGNAPLLIDNKYANKTLTKMQLVS